MSWLHRTAAWLVRRHRERSRALAGLPRWQRRLAQGLRVASWTGAIGALAVVGYVTWQLRGTDAYEAHSQRELMAEFEQQLEHQATPTTSPAASVEVPQAPVEQFPMGPALANEAPAPPRGSAVAVLRIPKLGLEKAVVEGVGRDDLKKGPGHYPGTPLPGQTGNAAIAGHRTTYGAPFNHLDELEAGDDIWVTTLSGRYHYVVSESIVTRPSDVSSLRATADNRLTLTTCHPEFSSRERLVVVAELVGEPEPPPVTPAPAATAPSTTASPQPTPTRPATTTTTRLPRPITSTSSTTTTAPTTTPTTSATTTTPSTPPG